MRAARSRRFGEGIRGSGLLQGGSGKSPLAPGRQRCAASPLRRCGEPAAFSREITAQAIGDEVVNNWGRVVFFDL